MHDPHSTQAFLRQVSAAVDGQTTADLTRLRVELHGAVQGVGFRPFVWRLASELNLAGWVRNTTRGVTVEVEGPRQAVETFLLRLEQEAPPRAAIHGVASSWRQPQGGSGFQIRDSRSGRRKTAVVLPDIAPCTDCLRELFDPADRRFRYPFLNCTNCGPRFSILTALPYDRPNTTMAAFAMCAACCAEYDEPGDRRFHAQPIACPQCGPHLEWWDPSGRRLADGERALRRAVEAIRAGGIVAVKGVGGFHLMVEARNDGAVARLRQRKHREEKPFAVMMPSLEMAKTFCDASAVEERLLDSPEAPIVLLRRRSPPAVAEAIAPGSPYLGIMLPAAPLHHLLMRELGFPVVATSGNRSDEPICTDEHDALHRLSGIAEMFLVHDRPIARHVDDSIVRVMLGRELILRRARGYAPLPVPLKPAAQSLLAVGAHLKNAVAVSVGDGAVVSQHLGDLETAQAQQAFARAIDDVTTLYDVRPEGVVCDAHPDYHSTQAAKAMGLSVRQVQHHEAHVRSCLAEHGLHPPALGVAWDGTGYGPDGTVWGGEFLRLRRQACERVAHLRPFRLPGGEQAVRQPRRSALGLLHAWQADAMWARQELAPLGACTPREQQIIRVMLRRGINAPWTSSIGRLFDAVASLTGLRQVNRFEAQAAMVLEYAAETVETDEAYDMPLLDAEQPMVIDWAPMVDGIVRNLAGGVAAGIIAAKFHNALAEVIVSVARRVGEPCVVLSGGCFQNRELTERAVHRLRDAGFRPVWHQRVPPNDGGIALGQLAACA